MLYPMLCAPAFKDYLWGGNRLKTVLQKQYEAPTMAESWELSCHPDGMSTVHNGPLAGCTLHQVLLEHPAWMGAKAQEHRQLPLLIKFIDAQKDLSIQVHPSVRTADPQKGEQDKTEIWYVLSCEPDAFLYYGFNRVITPEELKARAQDGSILDVLNRVPVKPGDVFHIWAGTIHAIGKGILLAEIQQNSNTTFRVYDFKRKDKDGKPRALHIEDAARAVNYEVTDPHIARPQTQILTDGTQFQPVFQSDVFQTERYQIQNCHAFTCTPQSFEALLCIDGQGAIAYNGEEYAIHKGECYFLPAGLGDYEIRGACEILRSML